ncbi:MAG: hypothetical protein ACP5LJ_04125 [Candidatus Bipolaricaulaceae bacterium]
MMKHLGLVVVLGIALGLGVLAEPAPVQLSPAQDEVKALREAWAQVLNVFEEFLVEFKGAVDTLNNNDQDLFSKYRVLAGQLKDLEVKLLQLRDMCNQKIPALEKSLAECSAQLAALRKSVEDAVSGYQAADAALEAKLTGLIGELRKSLDSAIAGYQAADKELAEKIAAMAAKLDSVIAGYQAADSELAGKIATMANQLDQLGSRVSVLESYDIGNLSRRVLSLEQAIQAIQIKIDNNREKIAALEKTVGSLSQDISSIKDSVRTLGAQVSDHDTRISDLEEKLGTNVQDLSGRVDMVQTLAILGLLAGIGAIALVLLGIGK